MEDEKMTMTEVLDEFSNWLEFNWYAENMSPSQYKQALDELEDLTMMDFEEIIDTYSTLNLDIAEFDFDVHDEEFEIKFSDEIKAQIDYIEEFAQNIDDYDSEW